MQFKEFDIVCLEIDYEEYGVFAGDVGAIVDVYSVPYEAYEVEFVNADGTTKAMFAIKPEYLKLV